MFERIFALVLIAAATFVAAPAFAQSSVSDAFYSDDPAVELILGPTSPALLGTSFVVDDGLLPLEGGLQYYDRYFDRDSSSDDLPPGALMSFAAGLTYAPADVVELGIVIPVFVAERTFFGPLPLWISLGHSFENFDIGGRLMVDPVTRSFVLGLPMAFRGSAMVVETGFFIPVAFRDRETEFAVDLPVRTKFDIGGGFLGFETGLEHLPSLRNSATSIPLGVLAGLGSGTTEFTVSFAFERMLHFGEETEFIDGSIRFGLGLITEL